MANLLSTTVNGSLNVQGSSMYVTASQLHIGKASSGTAQMSFESWGSYTGAIAMNSSGAFHWGGQGNSEWYFKKNNTYNGDYSASGTTVLRIASDGNIWSAYYSDWLSNVFAGKVSTSGGSTIAGTTYFSGGESMQVYGIRGRFTNEYIHLYNKVGIGHPSGWGQGQTETPSQGLSTYGGMTIAYGTGATSTFNGHLRINKNWGEGDFGAEQLTIYGTYPSITLRSTTHDSKWLIHNDSSVSFYYGAGASNNSWSRRFEIPQDGNIWMSWAGDYISNLLGAKQNASTAITTSNIGSQSVNYANSAGSAGQVSGVAISGAQATALKKTLDPATLPYSCDIYVEGDANTYYPVHFIWGDQDVWRRIIIKRGYSEEAPWDPVGSGVHHGGLLLDWEGNFGGWGGAEYSDRLRVFNESYTNVCADMYIYTHSMGYVFMLRGGHALYHIYSDQEIRGYNQVGTPDIAYDTTSTYFYENSGAPQYNVRPPAPVTSINSSRIDGLRTKKQSLFDSRYQLASSAINTSNIGSQSVNYASSAGSVAWTNVSSRPTALSQFTNDLGNYGGFLTSLGFSYSTGVSANHVVQRDGNGYIYANHINFNTPETENPAISSFITSNGDGWSRKSSLAHVRNQLGNYGNWITTDGRAYPRRSDGTNINFYWSSQGGQPTWLWGSNDGENFYVWNPSNFSVNYAASAGNSTNLDGRSSSRYLYYRGINAASDFQTYQSSDSVIRFDQVNDYNTHSNPPGGYTYGGVLSMRGGNFGFQLWGSHTGDFYFKTQWNDDQYSGWRYVVHSGNIGSQSVNYASSSGNADTVDGYHESAFWRDNQDRRINVLRFYGEGGNSGNGLPPYAIYQGGGDWTWPYPDLHIAYHTGIKIGANSSYQGVRFYTDYDMSTQVMSVNNGSDPLGGGNVYVNNSLQAGSSLRAPIFYDSNDTGYYGDFASTSRMNEIVYDNLKWAGDQTYGLIGRNGYLDTVNGRGTDPLELNYYDGGPVKIGSGTYGSKDLYASMVYVSSGNAVIHAGNIGSQNVNAANYQYATGSSSDAIYSFRQTPAHATSFREISSSGPAGTWWMIQNFRHSNSSNYWGTQVAWGWEDNALRLMQRNVSADSWSGWVEYLNSNNFTTWAQQKENQRLSTSNDVTFNTTTSPTILVNNHSDNTRGYRIHNTSGSSVSAMFTNSSNQLVIAAGAVDQINLNKKVYVNGVALGVNVTPSATAGRIDASNDIVAYSSSDERLKYNITPIENAIDKVKSLTGVDFDWKPEYKHAHGYEGHDTGIIAQQVQEVIPSAVRTNDTGFLAVRYEKLIGLLIEANKELAARVEELEKKLG